MVALPEPHAKPPPFFQAAVAKPPQSVFNPDHRLLPANHQMTHGISLAIAPQVGAMAH
jgi:hypothetical protein